MAKSTQLAVKKNDVPAKTSTGKALVAKPSKEQLQAAMQATFEAEAGTGFENVTAKDLLTPRLVILQSLSPQLIKSKPEFIKGAKAGDICDTATKEVWDEISVVPVHFEKKLLEWKPRASGGGLVKIHDDESVLAKCTKDDKGRWKTKDGNDMIESMQFYVLNLNAEGGRAFISFTSTQLKKARGWMTLSIKERAERSDGSKFQPPPYYRAYNLSVAEESNAQGSWFGWKIERGARLMELPNGHELLTEAKLFREGLFSGAIKVREDQIDDTHVSDSDDDEEDM